MLLHRESALHTIALLAGREMPAVLQNATAKDGRQLSYSRARAEPAFRTDFLAGEYLWKTYQGQSGIGSSKPKSAIINSPEKTVWPPGTPYLIIAPMHRIALSAKDADNAALEKRLWDTGSKCQHDHSTFPRARCAARSACSSRPPSSCSEKRIMLRSH